MTVGVRIWLEPVWTPESFEMWWVWAAKLKDLTDLKVGFEQHNIRICMYLYGFNDLYNQQNHVLAPNLSNIRSKCRRMEKKRAFWTPKWQFWEIEATKRKHCCCADRTQIPLQDPEKACWCSAQYIGLIHLNTYITYIILRRYTSFVAKKKHKTVNPPFKIVQVS